jgi:hypothetical protein
MASDAELIGRSLAGDGEAFMEVIGRHEVAIGAYLERRVGREAADPAASASVRSSGGTPQCCDVSHHPSTGKGGV